MSYLYLPVIKNIIINHNANIHTYLVFFQHEKNPRHFFQNMLVILYFYKLPFEFRSLHAQFMIPGHLTSLVRVFEKCRKPLGPISKCMR